MASSAARTETSNLLWGRHLEIATATRLKATRGRVASQ